MPDSGISRAKQNRAIRQKALREQLANKGLIQHVLVISDKLKNLSNELSNNEITRLRASAEIQLKLISKYLPDLKSVEISQDPDQPGAKEWTVKIVSPEPLEPVPTVIEGEVSKTITDK